MTAGLTWGDEGPPDVLARRLAEDLDAAQDTALDLDAREALAEGFLATLLGLGLALGRTPSLRELPAVRAALDGDGEAVRSLLPGIAVFVARLQALAGGPFEWGDEWRQVCEQRSALQFLLDTFGGDARDEDSPLEGLDLAALDAQLRYGCRDDAARTGPAGTPGSHWWWRCRG